MHNNTYNYINNLNKLLLRHIFTKVIKIKEVTHTYHSQCFGIDKSNARAT